jgi:hypothetical protein
MLDECPCFICPHITPINPQPAALVFGQQDIIKITAAGRVPGVDRRTVR